MWAIHTRDCEYLRFVGLSIADNSSQTESTILKIVKSSSPSLISYRLCYYRPLSLRCGLLESSGSFWMRFTVFLTTKEELFGSASLPSASAPSCANDVGEQTSAVVEPGSAHWTFCDGRSARTILSLARLHREDERTRVLSHSASSSVRRFSLALGLALTRGIDTTHFENSPTPPRYPSSRFDRSPSTSSRLEYSLMSILSPLSLSETQRSPPISLSNRSIVSRSSSRCKPPIQSDSTPPSFPLPTSSARQLSKSPMFSRTNRR